MTTEGGTVTVASHGAAAFVGTVWYLADGRSGDPLVGWPPRPPPVGFRNDDTLIHAVGNTRLQTNTERVLLATNASDADKALKRLRGTSTNEEFVRDTLGVDLGDTQASSSIDDLVTKSLDEINQLAKQNRSFGPSAYFPERDFALRWAEVVNRPFGLSYRAWGRRRLKRPSDKPLVPSLKMQSRPIADAYATLCKGWANPVLAAKRGIAVSDSRNSAISLLQIHSSINYTADCVIGANPDVVGDGTAEQVAPLLTGYDGFLDAKLFGENIHNDVGGTSNTSPDQSKPGSVHSGLNAWLAWEMMETGTKSSTKVLSDASLAAIKGSGWAVTERLKNRTRVFDDDKDESKNSLLENDGSISPESLNAMITTRAVDRTCVSVGECPRGQITADDTFPVDTPVFSSPLVHVVMPGVGDNGKANMTSVHDQQTPDGLNTTTLDGLSIHDESQISTGNGTGGTIHDSQQTYPLGVKLAMRSESQITVTTAQMYRPWFFCLEDLAKMVKKAIAKEAELRVNRNKIRREKTQKALAAALTAVCHTKPNPKLTGFQVPGMDSKSGRKPGDRKGVGVSISFGEDNDDDDDSPNDNDIDDDDEDPRNEGLEDDDDGSLNDDDLMKEYMREMVKDGSAEDALGSWARDAAKAAKEAKAFPGKDPKSRYQQLDVSPMAHAALIGAVTLYYCWNAVKSTCGNTLDGLLLKSDIGRYALVVDTPLADAMDFVEVGTFEGICAEASVGAAVFDVQGKCARNQKTMIGKIKTHKQTVSELHDIRVEKAEIEGKVFAEAQRAHDECESLKSKLGQNFDDTTQHDRKLSTFFDAANGAHQEGQTDELEHRVKSYIKRATAEGVSSVPEPKLPQVVNTQSVDKTQKHSGGIFRSVPLLKRVPFIGARKEKKVSERQCDSSSVTKSTVSSATADSTNVPSTETLNALLEDATARRDSSIEKLKLASKAHIAASLKEREAQMALMSTIASGVRDNLDAAEFANAASAALQSAKNARDKSRQLFDTSKGKDKDDTNSNAKDISAVDVASPTSDVTVLSSTPVDASQSDSNSSDSLRAPPLFVANLNDGTTLGDGTQRDGCNAQLRGFIGTGKYSHVKRLYRG